MSKDFEQAYKELAASEAPDLWERIEAGLSDKRSTQKEPAAEIGTETAVKTAAEHDEETAAVPAGGRKEAEKKKKVSPDKTKAFYKELLLYLRKYSAMAAAVICVIIVLPIFFRIKHASGYYENDSSAESGAAEDTAAQEAGEAAVEDVAMTENAMVTQESAEAESMSEENAEAAKEELAAAIDCEEDTEASRESGMEAAAGGSADTDQIEDAMTQAADEYKKESMQSAKQEEEILSHVIVEVTQREAIFEKDGSEEPGTVYTAVVREDPAEMLAEGEEITVFIPVYSSLALTKGGVFELDLGRQEGIRDSFIVCGYYGWLIEE